MKDKKLILDILVIIASVAATFLMAKFGLVLKLEHLITSGYILAFAAGMFFISFFTVVPSGYILVNLLGSSEPAVIALIAGLGAVTGDLLIFLFVRNRLSNNFFSFLLMRLKGNDLADKFKENKFTRIFFPVIGAAVIASPLPDEIGVALLGASRIKKRYFIPISYALNSAGIYLLLLASKIA